MKSKHRAVVALGLLTLALGACSSHGDHAAAAAQSPWLAVARGKVAVEGGLVQVAARADGVVETVAVRRGDTVQRGQVLAMLDSRAAMVQVAAARANVEQAQAQLEEAKIARKQAAQRAPRIAAAARAGAATGEAAEQAADAVATLKARQQAAQAALDGARQQLASAQLNLDATTLRAPVAGSIVESLATVGQTVAAASGQPLFELLPDRPHVIHAQLDVDAAGAVHAGMHAEVVRDSGSGPTYQATVLWVGQVLQPAGLTQDPLQRALANDVDCTLQLAAPERGVEPLRIGQRVLVRFPRPRS